MALELIQSSLDKRFSEPLNDFYDRRIIFWNDEEKEFTELIDELQIKDVKIIKLTGTNNFVVKKLLTVDDLENNYLVYNPISYEKYEDNWLLDIELYSEVFRADYFSIKMDELNIQDTPEMRKTIKLYGKFLKNEKWKIALNKLGREYTTPLQLHIDIMIVLCELKGGGIQDIIIAVLSQGIEKESNKHLMQMQEIFSLLIGIFSQMKLHLAVLMILLLFLLPLYQNWLIQPFQTSFLLSHLLMKKRVFNPFL